MDGSLLRDPGPATLPPPMGGLGPLLAVLVVRQGGDGGGPLPVRRPTVRLGRDAGNDLVLADPSVSAAHAELRLRGGVWTVTDLGSVNGTWVDGEPVLGALPLAPGSMLRVGEVRLAFAPKDRWEDSPVDRLLESVAPMEPMGAAPTELDPAPAEGPPAPVHRSAERPPLFFAPETRRVPGPVALFGVAVLAALAIAFLLFRTA